MGSDTNLKLFQNPIRSWSLKLFLPIGTAILSAPRNWRGNRIESLLNLIQCRSAEQRHARTPASHHSCVRIWNAKRRVVWEMQLRISTNASKLAHRQKKSLLLSPLNTTERRPRNFGS